MVKRGAARAASVISGVMVAAGAALAALAGGGAAEAKTRSCDASYELRLAPSQNKDMDTAQFMPPARTLARFRGEGSCRVANRCRERARNAIHACAQKHRATPNRIPPECTSAAGVHGYRVQDVKALFLWSVCCPGGRRLPPGVYPSPTAALIVRSTGGPRCGARGRLNDAGPEVMEREVIPMQSVNCAQHQHYC